LKNISNLVLVPALTIYAQIVSMNSDCSKSLKHLFFYKRRRPLLCWSDKVYFNEIDVWVELLQICETADHIYSFTFDGKVYFNKKLLRVIQINYVLPSLPGSKENTVVPGKLCLIL